VKNGIANNAFHLLTFSPRTGNEREGNGRGRFQHSKRETYREKGPREKEHGQDSNLKNASVSVNCFGGKKKTLTAH
jgi:hypothetical protein